MEKLKKAEAWLLRAEKGLLVALLTVMIVLSFTQVALRQLFRTGVLWGDTLLRSLVLWVGFLGAGLAAAHNKHFAWEAASQRPGRTGAALRLVGRCAAAAITALLAASSWTFLKAERTAGETLFTAGPVAAPAWIFAAIIPAGFILVFLHTVLKAAEAALELKGR